MSPYRGKTPVPTFALHVIDTTLQSSTTSIGWTVTPDVLAEVREEERQGLRSWVLPLEELPIAKRTIRLRYQDFKAKVCRPFAR